MRTNGSIILDVQTIFSEGPPSYNREFLRNIFKEIIQSYNHGFLGNVKISIIVLIVFLIEGFYQSHNPGFLRIFSRAFTAIILGFWVYIFKDKLSYSGKFFTNIFPRTRSVIILDFLNIFFFQWLASYKSCILGIFFKHLQNNKCGFFRKFFQGLAEYWYWIFNLIVGFQ